MLKPVFVGWILSVFLFLNASAQRQVFFDHLSVPDGLSSNNVRSVCQDDNGYMWIGTADGLNRYDGYRFVVYKNNPDDSTSLPDSYVQEVYFDSRGDLWVGTQDGVCRFDPSTNGFITFKPEVTLNEGFWVTSLFEDSRGRLWVGTRYEGAYLLDRETGQLSFPKVFLDGIVRDWGGPVASLMETAAGQLYLGSWSDGLLKFNEQEGLWNQVKVDGAYSDIISKAFIWKVHEDKAGQLWLGTNNGFYKYIPQQGTVSRIDLGPDQALTSRFNVILEDDEGYLWIGTTVGLFRYHLRNGAAERFTYDNKDPRSLSHNDIWCTFKDNFGILWFGTTGGGLNKYDPRKIPFVSYTDFALDEESAFATASASFARDASDDNNYWIGTANGLVHFNRKTGMFREYPLPGTAEKDAIRVLKEDESKGIWIGTQNNGLIYHNADKKIFRTFTQDLYNLNGLHSNSISDLKFDDYGNLWVATNRGLSRLDPRTGLISRVQGILSRNYQPDLRRLIRTVNDRGKPLGMIEQAGDYADLTEEFQLDSSAHVLVVAIGEGITGQMWDFGWLEDAAGNTLFAMDKLDDTFHNGGGDKNRMQAVVRELSAGHYRLRYQSDDSHAWNSWNSPAPLDSAWWGIRVLRITEQEARYAADLIKNDLEQEVLPGRSVRSLFYSRRGYLWVGTDDGLVRYDPKSRKIITYTKRNGPGKSLSDNVIETIFEDREGTIWIGTDRGLNRLDPVSGQVTVYHEGSGLPSGQISSIIDDNEGNLWIGTGNGISKFEQRRLNGQGRFINYDVQDGLQGYEFFHKSVLKNPDGELWFGGRNGFTTFFPGMINHTPPMPVINDFAISNHTVLPGMPDSPLDVPLMKTDQLDLGSDQNDLSFEFAAIHFGQPTKNRVYYRLEGFDTEWQTNARRFISYTNLDPGEYRFRIKGVSADGVESLHEKTIQITIATPWWATTWAYIFYGLMFIGGVFGVDRIQRYRLIIRERNRAQIREAELRAQAAEAQALAVKSENERKTIELEEARKLQLALLPEKLPELPNLEIAVYMKTATEVGGDYYDFNISADGTLNVALGDATGHGMQAGTVVTLMKGLFSADSGRMDIPSFFQQSSETIKDLRFGRMMMAFTMLKIKHKEMIFSMAGMPPAYIYRANSLKVEELSLSGMPLGAMKEFDYRVIKEQLESGDSLLLMSDGLPELKNPAGEQFDYPRVQRIFSDVADQPAQDIVDRMVEASEIWRKDVQPDDDITLMAIRVK